MIICFQRRPPTKGKYDVFFTILHFYSKGFWEKWKQIVMDTIWNQLIDSIIRAVTIP